MNNIGTIFSINGPVIKTEASSFSMNEMVYVGEAKLVGEVIGLNSSATVIQVYEETSGLKPGDKVYGTGSQVSVALAPGILNNIFDGIERPLTQIAKESGIYITKGVSVDSLDTSKLWDTHIVVKNGDFVSGGSIIAEVPETPAIIHKVMVPPNLSGYVLDVVSDGKYTINDTLLKLQLNDDTEIPLTMTQHWPIRIARPTAKRFPATKPLITGQ